MSREKNVRHAYIELCLKKRPTCTTCYNFYIHSSIATILGINVAEKVGNQKVFIFPQHLASASALPGKQETRKLHLFT